MGRLWRKQRKLEAKINWIAGEMADRPKGMRKRTFERILDRIYTIEEAKDAEFFVTMARLYDVHGKTLDELL